MMIKSEKADNNSRELSQGLSFVPGKIAERHLQRLAYVYVRQSSPKQVLHHRESQVNQYQLVQRAQSLGWSPERIQVIDTDQGMSGQDSASRNGFQQIVSEVSLGHVGIIFGYEVSRLARNNGDWYHLLDLAAVFGTLIADNDGVYDPRLYNDRLLLGLKGTMSEAELHLLRQRLDAGRMSQVKRGEYRQHLPTGLVRQPDGIVIKDPDEQVRHVIELLFSKFVELGSCQKVLRYLKQEGILLPRHQTAGLHKGEMLWKPPSEAAIYDILRNPAYAGAFAYGRKQSDPTRRIPGRPAAGRIPQPMDKWLHLQQGVYPAYISWEQYLSNRERLRQNGHSYRERTQGAKGAAREGACLLQGLATCGICSHHMRVIYKPTPRYTCDARFKSFAESICMSLHAPSIDEMVTQAFFEAIQPAQLDALEAILDTQHKERERLCQQWEDGLKRSRYESHLAERQYNSVDPDNRLVASTLERNWEEKLRQLQETEEEYERFQQTPVSQPLSPQLREQFRQISDRLPELWPKLPNSQKKELLRCLISRVILKRESADTVEVKIVWVSGHYSVVYAQPPIWREEDVTGYDDMIKKVQSLWQKGLDDNAIAAQLTQDGHRSARSLEVSPVTVSKIRYKHGWYYRRGALELDGLHTVRGLATILGVGRNWVYSQMHRGVIKASEVSRHPQTRMYLISKNPELIERLRRKRTENRST